MVKKIAVMSGKGGVGKSSISLLLSSILSETKKVLLLDFDICGPSCLMPLNLSGTIKKAEKGLVPLQATKNLYVISMASMIQKEDAVIWRGPKKLSLLKMFYESIDGFDYVIIDTPPGISEEHDFLIDKDVNALIVTTSQNVALNDTALGINFCLDNKIKIVGIVENMSGLKCKCCGKINNVFAKKGGEFLAMEYNLSVFCTLPLETFFCKILDTGEFLKNYQETETYKIFKENIRRII